MRRQRAGYNRYTVHVEFPDGFRYGVEPKFSAVLSVADVAEQLEKTAAELREFLTIYAKKKGADS